MGPNSQERFVVEDCCSRRGSNGPIYNVMERGEFVGQYSSKEEAQKFATEESKNG